VLLIYITSVPRASIEKVSDPLFRSIVDPEHPLPVLVGRADASGYVESIPDATGILGRGSIPNRNSMMNFPPPCDRTEFSTLTRKSTAMEAELA